ncbi:Maf family protein [Nitrincola schmidtii]|uniref:Maf family protein n=1 Tax=Nitrincola schmidtii TaxID=1730894 RepID=UPI00124E89A4|nr:nucleoside triphosphate pyrophosphatase [Nitrincola schmidtii]
MHKTIVLASSSPFRRELLDKLGFAYRSKKPDVDETPFPDEAPNELVARLAESKARAVMQQLPNALIIGSDQVAVLDGEILGKPGTKSRAFEQLKKASGRCMTFLTGLSLLDSETGIAQTEVVPFDVHFRKLTDSMIDRYLEREQPFNCAGSFKSEGLGIVLFDKLDGEDPNTLIGLPLIRLTRLLEKAGVEVI